MSNNVIDDHVRAFNARDLSAFLVCFSDEIEIFKLPGEEVIAQGLDSIRAGYAKKFNDSPDLNCVILNKMTQGKYTVLHEKITGYPKSPLTCNIALYEVENERIRRVWLIGENEAE
jgi:hypothetical protein